MALAFLAVFVVFNFVSTYSQSYDFEWQDADWHYRVGLEINSTDYDRMNWPVEHEINFTGLLDEMNISGTFDENSTRIFEYNSTGSILHEVPSQFDRSEGYDADTNAVGTMVFQMNGTTQADEVRYFYVYFDTTEEGSKGLPVYSTDITYESYGGVSEFNVTNSIFEWYVDTERLENTSGIYRVIDKGTSNEILRPDPNDNKTVEYSQLSNATDTFGFDFRDNATLKHNGSVRVVVEQIGEEILWNLPDNRTGEGYMIKRYTFYNNLTWIKIEQVFVNNASYNITRNSSVSGALQFNVNYSFYAIGSQALNNVSDTTDPGSYAWATEEFGSWWMGLVNIYENGTSNFYANWSDEKVREGIQLEETNVTPGSSIYHAAAVMFNGTGGTGSQNNFLDFVNQSSNPLNITEHDPEVRTVIAEGVFYMNNTDGVSIFNRNESVIIRANITDPYNLSENVNVTVDLGGGGELNMTLYDDGLHNDSSSGDNVYGNVYGITNFDLPGIWNVTFWVYNGSFHLINTSLYAFNVTDVYNLTVNITNPTGFTERRVNATVWLRNYRKDVWIPGAFVNCSFYPSRDPQDKTEIPQENITDNSDGTYDLWFWAPSYTDIFTLNCSGSKNNNTGLGTNEFTSETYSTNVSIDPTPDNLTAENVTSYSNQTFNISVLVKNTANGSAFDLNVTLDFSTPNITANTTFSSCGDVLITKNCTKTFEVIVLKSTPAGNYTLNISSSWRNSNVSEEGYNETLMNITVLPNPILNVSHDYLFGIIASGKPMKNVNNFTAYSLGNEPLQNVDFTAQGFPGNFTFQFVPSDISSLGVGLSSNVELWVNSTEDTPPGEYNGTINVTSGNNGFKTMNLTLAVSGTNMTVLSDVSNYTAENVTWYKNESFPIFVNTSNIGNATAYNASINLNFSSGNLTANESYHDCGDVPKGGACDSSFLITILKGTPSGNYTVNVSVQWEDPEEGTNTNVTTINITVLSNVNLIIKPDSISDNVTHGTEKQVGVIILNSTGNDPAINISFGFYNFSSGFTLETDPPNISFLNGLYPQGAKVNVSVIKGMNPGVYKGILNVTSDNGGYSEINLTIEVPTSRTWYLNTTYCERVESPEEGNVCEVLLNSTGNMPINFSITPATSPSSMYNNTWTSETNFTVPNGTTHEFSVFYNITGQPIQFYYANYTVDALQALSSPDSQILEIVLNPFIKPLLSVEAVPNQTGETESIWIYANVSDLSGAGIEDGNVTATVTRPDGSNDTVLMFFYGGIKTGGVSRWRAFYPDDPYEGNWGNTTTKGYYNVSVYATDNQGKNNTDNTTDFLIYSKLLVDMNTSEYAYGGDFSEIRMKTHDFSGMVLPGSSVNLSLTDPDGINRDYYMWLGNIFTTDSSGEAGCFYLLPSNPILGNYTFTANSSYYEPTVNTLLTNTTTFQFEVRETSEITAIVDIPDPAYSDKMMPVSVFVLDHGVCVPDEPESVNLTIYYTEGYSLQEWRSLTKANFTKNSSCFYTYTELLDSVLTGTYLAVLKVSHNGKEAWDLKAFRIVSGGPYDVEFISVEPEVPREDYLDFELLIENMGEVSHQDVLVEYWISGNNQTWDYGNASINVPANSNRTFIRSLFIYSFQPLGQYTLNARVTYDPTIPPAFANRTFYVVEAGPGPPPSPGPAPGGEAAVPGEISGEPKIEITNYQSDIGMEVGAVKYVTVSVKNTGGSLLRNVRLLITGIPSPWIDEIEPIVMEELVTGNTSNFRVKLKIPIIAEAKEYSGKITADANVTKDEKPFKITLFTTKEQLIMWEIDRLKKALDELETDIENAKKAGKDVSEVEPYIDRIEEQIDLAEDYLEDKMYEESLSAIHTGWGHIEKARYYLSIAPFIEILIETIFPPWLILLFIILAVVIGVLLLFVKRMKGVFDRVFRMQVPGAPGGVKPSVMVEKIKEKEQYQKQAANIRRVLGLIEKEFKEGLITESAYNDLKRRNEEKLKKIEERLGAMK